MIKRAFLGITMILVLISCSNHEVTQTKEVILYLKAQNKSQVENVAILQNDLYVNADVLLLKDEVTELINIDNQIQSYNSSGENIDLSNIGESLLRLKSKLSENQRMTQKFQFDYSISNSNELIELLEVENTVIELFRFNLWIDFLTELDNRHVVFAIPENIDAKEDSLTYYIGAAQQSLLRPNIKLKNGIRLRSDFVSHVKISKKDLSESEGIIQLFFPRISRGGYYVKEFELKNEFVKIDSLEE